MNEKWLTAGTGPIYKEDLAGERAAPYGSIDVSSYIPDDIPVVGRAGGGHTVFNADDYPVGEGYKRVHRPFDLRDPHAFAVEVEGNSMAPRYEHGDIVICSPQKQWRSGDYCVVVTKDDQALVKRVINDKERVLLISLAPGSDPLPLDKQKIRAIHKIVWKKET